MYSEEFGEKEIRNLFRYLKTRSIHLRETRSINMISHIDIELTLDVYPKTEFLEEKNKSLYPLLFSLKDKIRYFSWNKQLEKESHFARGVYYVLNEELSLLFPLYVLKPYLSELKGGL